MPLPNLPRTNAPRRSPALTWITAIFILTFTWALFLLVQTAVVHHFFSGERPSTNATVQAPTSEQP